MIKLLISIFCWGTFLLIWIFGGIYNYTKVSVLKKGKRLTNIWLILTCAAIVIILVKYIFKSSWVFIIYDNKWLAIIGEIILTISTVFTLWSRVVLGKMWARNTEIKENHKLCTEGPYNVTRHPIYTGIIGMIIGSALMSCSVIVLFLPFLTFFVFKIKINDEEKLLTEQFGNEYLNYKKHTPQLFPFIKFMKILRSR